MATKLNLNIKEKLKKKKFYKFIQQYFFRLNNSNSDISISEKIKAVHNMVRPTWHLENL